MTGGTGLIVNPRSHRVARHGPVLQDTVAEMPGGRVFVLHDFATLEREVAAMARAGVRRIFIEGGDGTLMAVLSACVAPGAGFDRMPAIGVLPGGSTNLGYKILGYGGKGRALAARVRAGEGREEAHRALRVERDGRAPLLGFLLSTGALARAMLYVQREFHGPGRRGSLAVAAAILRFVAAPGHYLDRDGLPVLRASDLRADLGGGSRVAGAHAFSLMTPLPRLSLGLKPFWGTGPGGIAVTHAAWPQPHFRRTLLRALAARGGPGLSSWRTDAVEICHDGPVMLDGEVLDLGPGARARITLTEPLRFLR